MSATAKKRARPAGKRKTLRDMGYVPLPKPPKPRKPTTAQQVAHLHDRITMLAGRLEHRTPGGMLAKMRKAAEDMQRTADRMNGYAADATAAINMPAFAQRLERIAGELNMLRQRVEGLYPLVMPKPAPEPESSPDDAQP